MPPSLPSPLHSTLPPPGVELGPSRPPAASGNPASKTAEITRPPASHRAQPPKSPPLPLAVQEAQRNHAAGMRDREQLERRSNQRGLILLAIVAFLTSLVLAGADRAFPAGWWQRW